MKSHYILEEISRPSLRLDPCILVIFGATGDLTGRRLMPAIYSLQMEGLLPANFACVGFARRDKNDEVFRREMYEKVRKNSRLAINDRSWESFQQRLFYFRSTFEDEEGYDRLDKFLKELDVKFGTKNNRVFYLSTPPKYFASIIEKLSRHNLVYQEADKERYSRVIVEKPFGHDLYSANQLQGHILKFLREEQIFRIDHWLGKETVQNLLIFRFANPIFESLWRAKHIDHVQITVAEDLGIGTRGHFFEEQGMLRDVMQNHMMQLLCLVAMEPPVDLSANAIRDEKVKILKSVRPIDFAEVIRGQYSRGYIREEEVMGYREEKDVSVTSNTETYVALKLFIDNWRWADVPFYLRTGKRLPKRATEIAITFKQVPGTFFHSYYRKSDPNVLIMRMQPNEGIAMKMNSKVPGKSNIIRPVKMDFSYGSYFGQTPPEAYERLIYDCMMGDSTLFARSDEVENSWRILTPLLEHWQDNPPIDFPNYAAGLWGPTSAESMLSRDNRKWRLI